MTTVAVSPLPRRLLARLRRHRPPARQTAFAAAVAVGLASGAAPAATDTATWVGGVHLWSVGANWSPAVVPDNAGATTFDVIIDGDAGTASLVTLDVDAAIESLTVNDGDTLNIASNAALTIEGDSSLGVGFVTNDGNILLQSVGHPTEFRFEGGISLGGTGTLTLGSNSLNRITTDNTVLLHQPDHTISGGGNLLLDTGGMTNQGTIRGDGTSVLIIDPNVLGFLNQGTVQAASAAGIQFNAGTYTNENLITVDDGSKLDLTNNVDIIGGTLSTSGSGKVNVNSTSQSAAARFEDVTIAAGSTVVQGTGSDARIAGSFTNDGTWQVNDAGHATTLNFEGPLTVGGSGRIVMGASTLNQLLMDSSGVLTLGANQTLEGAGQVLMNTGGLVNDGTILANSGGLMTVDVDANGFVNNGTVTASGSGGLTFLGGDYQNNTLIDVLDGSRLNLAANVNLHGGTLQTSGSGTVQVASTVGTTAARFEDVTIAAGSTVVQATGTDSRIAGTFVNHGSWQLNDAGHVTTMNFEGPITLDGSGEIVLSNSAFNRLLMDTSNVLTVGADQTLRGAGNVLMNTGGLVNDGTIRATGSARLTIDVDGIDADGLGNGFVNDNVLAAEGTGGLQLLAGNYRNNTTIDVADGSKLDLEANVRLQGGTLATSGSGVVNVNSTSDASAVVFEDVTVAAGSTVVQGTGSDARIAGTFVNDGTWQMNDAGHVTTLNFAGATLLDGSGEIVLSNLSFNRLLMDASSVLTVGADQTIRGAGNLLMNSGGLVNDGTIRATGSSQLTIDVDGIDADGLGNGFVNNNVLDAEGTGGLKFEAGNYRNNTTINVADGSKLDLQANVRLQGGTLATVGSGVVNVNSTSNASAVVFEDVTVAAGSTVVQASSTDARIAGTFVNDGTWEMNDAGHGTTLSFAGPTLIDGSGEIVLSNRTSNSLQMDASNVLTLGAGQTLRGAGNLLANTGGLVNDGTIRATGSSQLIIDVDGIDADGLGNGFVNNNVLDAEGTGGLKFEAGSYRNNTTINVADGSKLDLQANVLLQGGTIATAGSGVVNINSTNSTTAVVLEDVTLAAGSTVVQDSSEDARIRGTLVNDGTWRMNDAGHGTEVLFEDGAILDGDGRFLLSNRSTNRIETDGGTFTQRAGHTIEGSGALLNNSGGMVNQGTLLGNGTAGLTVDPGPGQTFDNQGVVEARSGGRVTFVDPGEVQNVAGSTLNGGTWNVIDDTAAATRIELGTGAGTANITSNNATILLSGVNSQFDAIAGLDDNRGSFSLADARDFDTAGDLANTGSVDVSGGARLDTTGAFTQSAGNTHLAGGTLSGTTVTFSGGSLTGSGDVEGVTHVGAGATVAAGDSPGILTFASDTTFAAGSILDFELAGTQVDGVAPSVLNVNTGTDPLTTQFDQLHVAGTATLEDGAIVNVATIDGFQAVGGNFWDLLTADVLALSDPANLVVDVSGVDGVTAANISFAEVSLPDPGAGGAIREALRMSIDALAVNAIWDGDGAGSGASGNFNDANWTFEDSLGNPVDVSPITSPDNTGLVFFNAFIDDGKAGTSVVTLTSSATVDSLSIDGDDELTMAGGRFLDIVQSAGRGGSGVLLNNGTIDIDAVTSAGVRFDGDGSLIGTGVVELGNGGFNSSIIAGTDGDDTLSHGPDHLIEGFGRIGEDLAQIDNHGTIRATTAGRSLTIGNPTGALTLVNTGTLESASDGNLVLDDARVENANVIRAGDGALVTLGDGLTLVGDGGVLESVGSGRFIVNPGNTAIIEGLITNNASVEVDATTVAALALDVDSTLAGSGMVALDPDGNFPGSARISGITGDEVLTQGADHTIRAAGHIGFNLGGFVNQGRVSADLDGVTMVLGHDTTEDGLLVDNTGGTLEAVGGATLAIQNARVSGGTVRAAGTGTGASVVSLRDGSTVAGGITLESTGGGVFKVESGQVTHFEGLITNNARIEIDPTTVAAIGIDEDTTLAGNGRIVLAPDGSFSTAARITGVDGDELLTQQAAHTIEGGGEIGRDLAQITNLGHIRANLDVVGVSMTLGDDDTADGLAVQNSGGTIEAVDGGELRIRNARISGGTLRADGGGVANAVSRVFLDDGSTLAHGTTLESVDGGLFGVSGGQTTHFEGTITNNARIEIDPTTAAEIAIDQDTVLAGSGSIALAPDGAFSTNARIRAVDGDEFLTNGAGHTIEGGGRLGFDELGLTNDGSIVGNVNQMVIDPRDGTTFSNRASGTIRGETGGSVLIQDGTFSNLGTVEAVADGGATSVTAASSVTTTQRAGSTLTAGTWRAESVDGSQALVDLQGGAAVVTLGSLATVTLRGTGAELRIGGASLADTLTANAGTLNLENGQVFDTSAGLANSGTVNVHGAATALNVAGNYDQSAGTTTLTDATLSASTGAGSVNITGGLLAGTGTVDGTLNVNGGGTVASGFSPGILNVTGDFNLGAGGFWGVELAGTDPVTPDFDQILVGGAATFDVGAQIDLALLGGFAPQAGDFFDLMVADSIIDNTGDIASLFDFSGAALDPGFSYAVELLDNNATAGADTLRLLVELAPASGVIEATWNGGAGNFGDDHWTQVPVPAGTFPDNTADTFFDVSIDGNEVGTASSVTLAQSVTIDRLRVDGGDSLAVDAAPGGTDLTLERVDGDASRAHSGRILNDGVITVNSAGADAARIVGTGDLVVDGTGTVVLSDHAANAIRAGAPGSTLTNESQQSISGAGTVGSADTNVVNRGTIDASAAANALVVQSQNPLANEGTLRASGSGGMQVQADVANTGLVQAQGGSSLAVSGTLTNDATVDVDTSTLTVGGLTNNAALTLNEGTLDSATAIVNNAGATLSGNGTIGQTVSNGGTVIASGGTLVVNGAGIQGASGSVQVNAGAGLDLSGASGPGSADFLVHDGLDLNLGANDFQVAVDYSNGNAGTGNAFDARANVTGSGAIVAAGDTVQAITGDVTGGATATPTIDFGEVHVGSNTLRSYQVANDGTTGPDLRGAIQTVANGGNIDDARLIGSGVTAQNFGPLAAGASTGDLQVRFDATAAGALSGQQIHVENNFDNVAGQDIAVTGTAFNLAQATIQNAEPIFVGNFHLGDLAAAVDVGVANSAPVDAQFTERLAGQVVGSTGTGIIAGGAGFSGLEAGQQSAAGALTVSIDTSSVGSKGGDARFTFQSDGAGINSLGVTSLGIRNVAVTGNVWALAEGDATNVLDFGAVRVGDAAVDRSLIVSNIGPDTGGFTETLRAEFGPSPSNFAVNGSSNASAETGIALGTPRAATATLRTDLSGNFDGATLQVDFVSEGAAGLADTALGSQDVVLNGRVYQAAEAAAAAVDFGVLRRGSGVASRNVAVSNTATGALVDELVGGFTGDASPFVTSGTLAGVAGGTTDGASLQVAFDATTAGAFDATGTLALASHNAELADVALAPVNVGFTAVVNEIAQADVGPTDIVLANQRVGGTLTRALTVTNTDIAPAGFQEGLDARFDGVSGDAVASGGPIVNLGQGVSDSATLQVGIDTADAGARSGTATLALESNGTLSGLANLALGTQDVTVSGNVYQVADGRIDTAALDFGIVQVGQAVSQALDISNVATGPAGFVEDLNARFGASSGTGSTLISGSGEVAGLAAGGTDSGSMVVNVDTSAVGTVNGAIAVDWFSAGAVGGVSNGLGELAVGSDSYGVQGTIETSGTVIDRAAPVIDTPDIALGNVRIGSASPSANVSVTNVATGNQQAALNASIAGNAPITAAGSFDLLAPGATDATSLSVGMDTSVAGAVAGTATVSLVSDATPEGCTVDCQLDLVSQDVNVTGAVYRLASPQLDTPLLDLGARRVGDAAASAAIGVTNASPDPFTEALKVDVTGSAPAVFSTGGAIAALAAGASDTASITVGLDTATAGDFSGSVDLAYTSTGAGTTGAADLALGSDSVAVSGRVYQAAEAAATDVDFGILRRGSGVVQRNVAVSNTATGALVDELRGGFTASSAPFATSGNLLGVASGDTDSTSLLVGVDTATAGVFNGTGTLGLASHNDEMADADLAPLQVAFQAVVNDLANPVYEIAGGDGGLSGGGPVFSLDLGTIVEGSGATRSTRLAIRNDVAGPADFLTADGFSELLAPGFDLDGFLAFGDIGAGALQDGFEVAFDSSGLLAGLFTASVTFDAFSTLANGADPIALGDVTLNVRVRIVADGPVGVSATPTLLLALLTLAAMLRRRRVGVC